jgi:hypothetical protein
LAKNKSATSLWLTNRSRPPNPSAAASSATHVVESSAAWGLHDNDGDGDFYFGRQNQLGTAPATILLSNNGVSVSEDTSAGVALWSRSAELQAMWGDFNRDGWIDIVCGGLQSESIQSFDSDPFSVAGAQSRDAASIQREWKRSGDAGGW